MTISEELLARYWGKADAAVPSDAGHHTVLGHSLDVSACAFVLVDRNPVLRDQFAHACGVPSASAAITVAAICALHDIGKLDTRFQRKAPRVADQLRPNSAGVLSYRYDHGTEGFRQTEADEAAAALFLERFGSGALPLLRAVCGHHGALPRSFEPDDSYIRIPPDLRIEDAMARRTFMCIIADFFIGAGAVLPWQASADGPLVQRVAGLCAVADWLGSDVEHFPYSHGIVDPVSYWASAVERAVSACASAGLLRAPVRFVAFSHLFPGCTPRDVQEITESLAADEPALVIIEAEMGKGKTEAALALAARFLARGHADGITIALPTMATSNAMFSRVEAVVPRIFGDGQQVQLALAHGRSRRYAGFQHLIQHGLSARDEQAPEAEVMCARWLLKSKRVLLAQVGVGTIDQALQAAIVVRHQFVRMFGLSRNVVIIDEVHAYDAYMEVLLDHLVGWLGAMGVPVILLSATLPSARRAELARAWRGEEAPSSSIEPFESAVTCPYPLVTVVSRTQSEAHALPVADRSTKRVELERLAGLDEVAVAHRLIAAASDGARVVWIRNTVREAQKAARAVEKHAEGDVEWHLFHARFRGCDRHEIESRVLARFGKDAPAGGRILIATQVVEQSLDLDFDVMHSDLAPVDLLLQRMGRLHRHARRRPRGFECPRLVVHVPTDVDAAALRFGPSRYVYDPGTLWLADRMVRSREDVCLPSDIRELVEEVYHPASRAKLLSEGGPALTEAERELENELKARRAVAARCCIAPTTADPDGDLALDDDDDRIYAFTRDGVSTTLLPFCWDNSSARLLFSLGEPWDLDPNSPTAWRTVGALLDQTVSIPARGEMTGFVRGRPAWWSDFQRRFARFADSSGLGTRVVPVPMSPSGDGYEGIVAVKRRLQRVRYTRSLGLEFPKDPEDLR